MVQSGGFIYRILDPFKIKDRLMSSAAKLIKEKLVLNQKKTLQIFL